MDLLCYRNTCSFVRMLCQKVAEMRIWIKTNPGMIYPSVHQLLNNFLSHETFTWLPCSQQVEYCFSIIQWIPLTPSKTMTIAELEALTKISLPGRRMHSELGWVDGNFASCWPKEGKHPFPSLLLLSPCYLGLFRGLHSILPTQLASSLLFAALSLKMHWVKAQPKWLLKKM
jgi:hypothetical protein